MSDLDWIFNDDELETSETIEPKVIRRDAKRKMKLALQEENAEQCLPELPQPGESFHIISNGGFGLFSFVPLITKFLPHSYCNHVYVSTWVLNRSNVIGLFELFDTGKIGNISVLSSRFVKRRDNAVFALLIEGMLSRNQRFRAFRNHAKVSLMHHEDQYIVIETSANFTDNPRVENFTITNDKKLWEFHRNWMELMLNVNKND